MQLSTHDLRSLPLRAALVERADEVVVHTPEWDGAGTACVAYPVRRKRLLVATRPAHPDAAALAAELIRWLQPAPDAVDSLAMRRRMLAASLGLLTGALPGGAGAAEDAIAVAREGIAARCAVTTSRGTCEPGTVRAPEVVALVLVQLAVNAARHGGAAHVTVSFERSAFHVTWPAPADLLGAVPVRTARRHADRERWGLGFARVAADALGATVYPPARMNGTMRATLEVGIGRLSLPLAIAAHGAIVRATRAWDEETGVLPGSSIASSEGCAAVVRQAQLQPGVITTCDGWSARTGDAATYIAVPPDDAAARMQDVLDGLVHEHALLAGVDPATGAHVTALAHVLGVSLGRSVPRVPAGAWVRRMHALAPVLGLRCAVPPLEAIGAADADVCAVLAARTGGTFVCDGDALWLDVPVTARDDPMMRCLGGGAARVRLA